VVPPVYFTDPLSRPNSHPFYCVEIIDDEDILETAAAALESSADSNEILDELEEGEDEDEIKSDEKSEKSDPMITENADEEKPLRNLIPSEKPKVPSKPKQFSFASTRTQDPLNTSPNHPSTTQEKHEPNKPLEKPRLQLTAKKPQKEFAELDEIFGDSSSDSDEVKTDIKQKKKKAKKQAENAQVRPQVPKDLHPSTMKASKPSPLAPYPSKKVLEVKKRPREEPNESSMTQTPKKPKGPPQSFSFSNF